MKKMDSNRFRLLELFAVVVFLAILAQTLVTGLTMYLLARSGFLSFTAHAKVPYIGKLMFLSMVISLPIGVLISIAVSQMPLKPVRDLINCMDALASGNYKTRFTVGPFTKRYPAFVKIADSFNKMARELESTEMLRSDFINNFSHEFKTPIVSIAGFAKLLRRGNLTDSQKQEYLDVIESESLRLSDMATNVLNLTRVENQTILTDVTSYNLSEQIRGCLLLLEDKWDKKNLDFQLNFGEYYIRANQELMKQVFINLLDNAIKFSPEYQSIEIQIGQDMEKTQVSILNSGSEIPEEKQALIFNKFYQADESHSTCGNGVGLAIVKRITDLHGGTVSVESAGNITVFRVELPR